MTKFVGTLNIPSLASAPSTAIEGDLYYNTATDKVNFYNGTTWSAINQASGAMNYAQTQGTKQSTISASGVTIVSTNITTSGYPIQVLVTGDAENNGAGAWVKLQLYRDSTAIGKIIHVEGSAGSENIPYALTVIDTPSAGTYTYSLKTASAVAGGSYTFGETDGPVLSVIELSGATTAGVTTLTGTANQVIASASTGAVTLSLPQSIATTSTPTFGATTINGAITGAGTTTNLVHGVTLNRTTDLSINSSDTTAATAISWSGVVSESGLYDYWSSGSTITAPVAGWYIISCHVLFGTGSAYSAALFVSVDGTIIAESEMQAEATTRRDTLGISTVAYLAASAAIIFRASSNTTGKVISGTGQRSRCSVVYLGSQT